MKAKKNIRTATIFFLITCHLFPAANSFSQTTRSWATYYGGIGNDQGLIVATDASGNVYLAGSTDSPSGIASGGFQNTFGGGGNDAFLVKFDAAGNRLWATYYGEAGLDIGKSVVTDAAGNVYLAGSTDSPSGIASGGFQNTIGGGTDAFLVKFDAAGNRLWATYYGETGLDNGNSVATDAAGNVYLAGETSSSAGIASGGFQNTLGGGTDAFLVKFDAAGNRLWATYYGSTGTDFGNSVVANAVGNVYLAGSTDSPSGIASGGFQNTYGGSSRDAFLVKLDATSGNRVWATYYGQTGRDFGNSVAADAAGNVYLAGLTNSSSGIASGGFQNTLGGGFLGDAYLVKFDSNGNRLWATYLGGTNSDYALSVVTDAASSVYLAGDTYSVSGIASGGFQNSLIGSENEFVAKFDAYGNMQCSTYYGQAFLNDDEDGHIAVDGNGNVYLSGYTPNSGIASGGFQNSFGGGINDAYLVKFVSCFTVLSTTISSTNVLCNSQCTGTATANATGETPPYTYSWNTLPAPQTTQTISNLCAGTYSVVVTDFAATTTTATVTITQPTAITSSTSVMPCVNGFPNGTATVTSIGGTPAYTYLWTTTPAQTTATATGLASGTYAVVVADNNNCSNTTQAVIAVCQADSIFVPNVFSPNGDGVNDIFTFPNAGYKTLHCEIFNRWGTKIYEWEGTKGGWDGRTNSGKTVVDGVYYYIMSAEKLSGEEFKNNGFLQLLRNQ